ncbi:MAG: NAD(P)H-binding protein, partial [Pseudomonadota bacterium]
MSNQTILVSGATGTNGGALITTLSTKDVTVRALVRDKSAAEGGFPAGVEIVEGDLADPQSLARAFEGVDKAYIVTAVQPNTTELFQNFYDAAKAAGVSQLVKFSGLGASTTSSSE